MECRSTTPDGHLVLDDRRENKKPILYVCIKDLSTFLPGYDGTQRFERGLTRVSAEHEALAAHPDCFAKANTAAANRALRSRRSGFSKLKRPGSAPPPIAIRSRGSGGGGSPTAPWNIPPAERAAAIPRPSAPRADDIWDLDRCTFVAEPERGAPMLRDRALRAIERARFPHGGADPNAIRGRIVETMDAIDGSRGDFSRHLLKTGSPRYRDAFAQAARGGFQDEVRALNLGSGEGGGFLLPFTLDPTIIATSAAQNPLRAIARTEQTMENLWKGVSSEGVSGAYGTEGTEWTDAGPTFAQPEIEAHPAKVFLEAAYEFDQDFGALEPQIAGIVARAKNTLEATKFLSGSGTNEPFGLLTGATEVIETGTKGTVAAADVDALEAALPAAFLDAAQWLGNRAIFKDVRKLDTEGGAQRWAKLPGSQAELIDHPVNYLSTMTSTIASNGKPLVIGDFSYFLVVDRIGMRVVLQPTLTGGNGRPTGQMGVLCMWRNGAKVLTKSAFRVLKIG